MPKIARSFIAFLSTLVLLFTSTAIVAAKAPTPTPRAKWTVMVYISGDNNLESYVVSDIETELAPTGSSANVQVVALADRAPGYDTSRGDWQTTKLFHVTKGMLATPENAVADWGDQLP